MSVLTDDERREKKREYDRKWRAANREATRDSHRRWKAKNPDYERSRYLENQERLRKDHREYYEKNKTSVLARVQRTRSEHPERHRESNRKWPKRHPEGAKVIYRRYKYGIEPEQYDAMVRKQDGCCAICHRRVALCVDHNHSSGGIRALLCRACNSALGLFSESPDILRAAADYLEHHNGSIVKGLGN